METSVRLTDVADYLWCDPEAAAKAAHTMPAMDVLRVSHGMLSREMFANALANSELQIILMRNSAMALVAWGMCEEGKTLHVLTIATHMECADEVVELIEKAARDSDAQCIMAVTRHGWHDIAQRHDFDVHRCLFIKKVLQ